MYKSHTWLEAALIMCVCVRARVCVCVRACVCVYSSVQWKWFSGVTGCTWMSCFQWCQRTNFTAPGCVCVSQRKKVPDEWQARQTIPVMFQVSSSMQRKLQQEQEARFISQSLPSLGHDVCFLFFSSNFFLENHCRSTEKTNKPPKNKHGPVLHRGNAKCDGQEAFARCTINDTIDKKKNSSFLRGHRLAVQRKKERTSTCADLFCCFFEIALPLSLSLDGGTHRHSERTCARGWSGDGRTSSSFFSVKVNVLPTTAITQKKLFFRDVSSEIGPWIIDESLSCSSAPIKATHQAIETGGTLMQFEEQCTAKNNFETS